MSPLVENTKYWFILTRPVIMHYIILHDDKAGYQDRLTVCPTKNKNLEQSKKENDPFHYRENDDTPWNLILSQHISQRVVWTSLGQLVKNQLSRVILDQIQTSRTIKCFRLYNEPLSRFKFDQILTSHTFKSFQFEYVQI